MTPSELGIVEWHERHLNLVPDSNGEVHQKIDVVAKLRPPAWPGWTMSIKARLNLGPDGTEPRHHVYFQAIEHEDPDSAVLPAAMSRATSMPKILAELARQLAYTRAELQVPDDPSAPHAAIVEALKSGNRPGRTGRDDLHYARWAREYVGCPTPTPIVDLAQTHGYTPSTIRSWINQARRKGLLTEAPGTKPGGQLTDKALALLSATD